jgi:hypothetical protein
MDEHLLNQAQYEDELGQDQYWAKEIEKFLVIFIFILKNLL